MLISKWGNSLGLRLPKEVAESMHVAAGDRMNIISVDGDTITLRRDDSAARLRQGLRDFRVALPADYRFDRDDANQR